MMRGHHAHNNLRIAQRFFNARSCANALRNGEAGKERSILVSLRNRLAHLRRMRPESQLMIATVRKTQRNRSAPRTAAHHGNTAHAALAFVLPKRYSVP